MTNMFKKSLIAIALASVGTSAMAAELSSTTVNVAQEWASTVAVGPTNNPLGGETVTVAPITLTLNAAYTQNDTVTLTFTGNSLITGTAPTSLDFTGGGETGAGTATLGLISSTANDSGNIEVVYRVTEVSGDTTNATGVFEGFEFMPRRLEGSVSVSFAAATSTGQALDTTGGNARTAGLIRVGSQFGAIVPVGGNINLLTQTVDVARERMQFVGFDGSTSTASGQFQVAASSYTVADDTFTFVPDTDYGVSNQGVEYTLNGDFSWLLDEDGEVDSDYDFLDVNCAEYEITASQIVAECTAGEQFNPIFTVEASNDRIIPAPQTFGLDAVVTYDAEGQAGAKELTRSAGTWGLNGSTVQVAYMPFNGNITQVINVTNRSQLSGDISVVAIDEAGRSHNLGVIGESSAQSIKPIAGQIQDALSEATGIDLDETSVTRRFALQITTNVPSQHVEVYSAYNVGQTGARLVVNDSNGGGRSK